MLKATATNHPEILLLAADVFADERGFFFESFNQRDFEAAVGSHISFVQDNQARSAQFVLRGLHYQVTHPQGKLVRVLQGRIFDVAVDLRRHSSRFGQSVCVELSSAEHTQMWIPPGFAHGYLVLSEGAEVAYKTTAYRAAEHERRVLWSDPAFKVDWPLDGHAPVMSEADRTALPHGLSELFD